jgi:endonuclease/exonuclease/phosphatase family metal-dependent hydrolase
MANADLPTPHTGGTTVQLTAMSQNVQYGADQDGRWEGMVDVIRQVAPQLLFLQEVSWLADPDAARAAGKALGMEIRVAPSRNLNTAVAWDPDALQLGDIETKYSQWDMHHGYCAPQFKPWGAAEGLPAPLVAISTHLTPYSSDTAAQEAQLLCARAYRHGGIAIVAGDINHPTLDDEEPDWTLVQPYNRTSRCLRREGADDPWISNRIVARTFRDGEFTDIAAHLADQRQDPSLRRPTGKAGLLRVDQVHVTPALVPAVTDYRVVESDYSDHRGLVFTLDLARADGSKIRSYT